MNDKSADKFDDADARRLLMSFYLSTDVLEKIEDFLFYARKRLPIDKRRKLTKAAFYETSLRLVIEDYQTKGEESSLWKAITKLMKN